MVYRLFYAVIILLLILSFILLGISFFVEKDLSRTGKISLLILCILLTLFHNFNRMPSSKYAPYEDTYKKIITGSFSRDKASHRKLMKALVLYDSSNLKKALKILNKLNKKCISAKDYEAVHTLKGLCHYDSGHMTEAISSYQKALQYNTVNSTVWSNLGVCHRKLGQDHEAFQAYSNALIYDAQNPYPHLNMATYLFEKKELTLALEYALTAYTLNSNLPEPVYIAAIAYKLLGYDENFHKFSHLYQMNGGSLDTLSETISRINRSQETI